MAVALPLRVLFVGDSFTYFNNLPRMVAQIAAASPGRRIEAERVTHSSWSLEHHLVGGTALARIREGRWDVVVLQEEGALPITDPARFQACVRRFATAIRAAHARPMLLMTWAQRTKPNVQPRLADAYRRVGRSLNVPVAPVGEAWRLWQEDPSAPSLYVADDIHPNFRGSFLTALVLVGRLRGQPLSVAPTEFPDLGVRHSDGGTPFDPRIDPAELPRLLRCAEEALEPRTLK